MLVDYYIFDNKAPARSEKISQKMTSDSEYIFWLIFERRAGAFKSKCSKKSSSIGVRSKMDAKVLKFYATLNTHISGVLEAF